MANSPSRQRWLQRTDVTHVVTPDVWSEIRDDLPWEAKLVRLYVATCPNRTVEGFFELPIARIVRDTGLDATVVTDSLDLLGCCDIIFYDFAEELVLDPMPLQVARLGCEVDGEGRPRDKRVIGAARYVQSLPDTMLKQAFELMADDLCPPLARELRLHTSR